MIESWMILPYLARPRFRLNQKVSSKQIVPDNKVLLDILVEIQLDIL